MKLWSRFSFFAGLFLAACAFGQSNAPAPLELRVKKVFVLQATQSPVVILMDKAEKQFLPIWIGMSEAQAIALEMEHFKPPRPMTHDLLANVLKELESKVEKVVITETKANTYFATLSVSTQGRTKEIDCRPSDGIALALRVKAPIFAAPSVMQNAMAVPAEVADEGGAQRLSRLAVTVQTLTPDLAEALGTGVQKGVLVSDSQQPKIERGDVVVAVDGIRVQNAEEFTAALEKVKPGKELELKIERNHKVTTIRVSTILFHDREMAD